MLSKLSLPEKDSSNMNDRKEWKRENNFHRLIVFIDFYHEKLIVYHSTFLFIYFMLSKITVFIFIN